MMKNALSKRFLSLFCVAVMLLSLCTLPAAAAGVDLSSMTDAEVTALLGQVNQEIADRGIRKTAKLPRGAYIAGKDIPVGSYVYTCLATGEEWGNVTIYSEGGSGKQLLWEVVMAPEDGGEATTIYMTLNEGDQLKSGVAFSLTIPGGALFQ